MLNDELEILFRRPDNRVGTKRMRQINNPRVLPDEMIASMICNTSGIDDQAQRGRQHTRRMRRTLSHEISPISSLPSLGWNGYAHLPTPKQGIPAGLTAPVERAPPLIVDVICSRVRARGARD